MINLFMLSVLAAFQVAESPPPIWEEIGRAERQVNGAVSADNNRYVTSTNDPVRGYYVDHVGVVLFVPLRYRPPMDGMPDRSGKDQAVKAVGEPETPRLERGLVAKRLKTWKDAIKKSEVVRDAYFEQVVAQLQRKVPDLLTTLTHLPQEENLTIIIEERPPAWFSQNLSLKKNPTRKVVTLSIGKELIAKLHKSETVLDNELKTHIKRTTTKRRLYSLVP